MSEPAENQAASPALAPPSDARAARLERFRREQLIVDYLNRGVSVAEVAARIGVGEKRARAVIRDILARRQPHPPAEFLAIQVSRLNEALLVAYGAMGDANLKAVAEVRRLVRDLDRYHGFAGAGRPSLPRLADRAPEPPVDVKLTFGAALICRAEFAPQVRDPLDRPGDAAPTGAAARPATAQPKGFYARRRSLDPADDAPAAAVATGALDDPKPETGPLASDGAAAAAFRARVQARLDAARGVRAPGAVSAEPETRPDIPAQGSDIMGSAPGRADPDPRPRLHHEGHRGPPSLGVASCPSWWTSAPQPGLAETASFGRAPDGVDGAEPEIRPETPSQGSENADSAPGPSGPDPQSGLHHAHEGRSLRVASCPSWWAPAQPEPAEAAPLRNPS